MNGWRVWLVLLVGMVMSCSSARATIAGQEMLLRRWTTRDGLPNDRVRAIVRTRDGFLWVGTDSGLARFDGREFRNYGMREGLGSVAVFSLLEAQDGSLWIGTLGGGISVVRNGRVAKTYGLADGLPGLTFSMFAEEENGHIWASGSGGTAYFDGIKWRAITDSPNTNPLRLRALASGPDGSIWAVFPTLEVKCLIDGKWQPIVNEGEGPRNGRAILIDSKKRPWVADMDGVLWCRDDGKWSSIPMPDRANTEVISMAEVPGGSIWMIVHRGGIVTYREGVWSFPRVRGWHADDSALTVAVDRDGCIWLGSSSGGLHSFVGEKIEVGLIDENDPKRTANLISSVIETKPGTLLLGTQGKGLFQADDWGVTPVTNGEDFNDSLFINALCKDRNGAAWAATSRGLFKLDHEQWKIILTDENGMYNSWDLLEDMHSGMWVGTGNGRLYHVFNGQSERVLYGGSATPIKGLAQKKNGELWIGTRGDGLFHGQKDGTWTLLGKESGLKSEIIRVITIGPDGQPWVGTMGGGLSIWNGEHFSTFTTQEGLPDDTLSQLYFDQNGRLWAGTNRGLAVFSQQEVQKMTSGAKQPLYPIIIDQANGLLSEEFTIAPPVKSDSGLLIFATTKGYVLIHPEDITNDNSAPKVIIEKLLSNGKEIAFNGGQLLELSPGSDRLEIHYASPYFGSTKRLQFRNRLVGVDDDWNAPSSTNFVEYRSLAPGRYRFEVEATSGNGLWSGESAEVNVFLKPHWWQQTWFRIFAISLLGTILALILHTIWRRKADARILDLRRRHAVHEERARIARDLHDDVGAGLTQVALLSELVGQSLKRDPNRAEKQVDEIFTTANELTRALDEIIWATNPEYDTLESFVAFLGTYVQKFCATAKLKSRIHVRKQLPSIPLDSMVRHHVHLATKEILHNTVKHSSASEVSIRIDVVGKRMHLEISDNGCGFDKSAQDGEDGLKNIRFRMAEIGGKCKMDSHLGIGTRVDMWVPLNITSLTHEN